MLIKRISSVFCSIVLVSQVLYSFPLSISAITTSQVDNSGGEEPYTAYNYNGHSYYTFSGKADSWKEAQAYCESLGGYLAVINDANENDYLYSLMLQQGHNSAYFGLYLDESDDKWKWAHDDSFYVNWDEYEPSGGEYEGMFYGASKWNDGNFGAVDEFICEWNFEDASIFNLNAESGNKMIYNGHSYAIFNNVVDTWDQAKVFCEKKGGYLAVINDAAENEAVFSIIRSLGYENVYFGYTDKDSEGSWHWVENDSSTYINWGKEYDEPNGGEFENYAMFYQDDPTGEWNDGDFGEEGFTVNSGKAFICEWNSIEDTAPVYEDKSFDLCYTGNDQKTEQVHFSSDYSLDHIVSTTSAFDYSIHLSYVLSIISSSAYTPKDIAFNLNSLGFEDYRMFNYYKDPIDKNYAENSSAFSIAKKMLPNGELLVFIPIRGSYGGLDPIGDLLGSFGIGERSNSDWASDLNIWIQQVYGMGKHSGFDIAMHEIYSDLEAFLGGSLPTTNVKYVITGHSRAAGIGNLLSKKICDAGVDSENVFDYNFACPDVAKDYPDMWNPDGIYNNIFNIGIAGDPITLIPGLFGDALDLSKFVINAHTDWGKYGRSYWASKDWKSEYMVSISSSFSTVDRHAHENYVSHMSHEMPLSKLKNYNQLKQQEISNNIDGIKELPQNLWKRISGQINCPVNVEVIDPSGKILALITEDDIQYYTNEEIVVFVWTEDDHKRFIVFGCCDVTIKLVGTDNGVMSCAFSSESNGKYQSNSFVFYDGIELTAGKTMELEVSSNHEKQAEEIKVYGENDEVNEVIQPTYFMPSAHYGDLNHDNQLLIADVVLLTRLTAEDELLDQSELAVDMADVNCDENVDILDVTKLLETLQNVF